MVDGIGHIDLETFGVEEVRRGRRLDQMDDDILRTLLVFNNRSLLGLGLGGMNEDSELCIQASGSISK